MSDDNKIVHDSPSWNGYFKMLKQLEREIAALKIEKEHLHAENNGLRVKVETLNWEISLLNAQIEEYGDDPDNDFRRDVE